MPQRLRYRTDGPDGAPVIVLGPSRRTTLRLWDPVVTHLAEQWQVLRFDLPARHTPAGTADELVTILDQHGMRRVVYCGVSSSAGIGQHLAVHRPHRLHSLVLVCDTARFGDPATWANGAKWLHEFFTGYNMPAFPGTVGVRTVVLTGAVDSAGPPALAGELAPGVPAGLLHAIAAPWHPARIQFPVTLAGLLHEEMLEI